MTAGDKEPASAETRDRALQESLTADFEDFASYGPILGCAVVPAMALALLGMLLLDLIEAPGWADYALALVYVTFPFAAFVRWVWTKESVRLPSGAILSRHQARYYALSLWVIASIVILWRMIRS